MATVDGKKGDHVLICPPYTVTEEELGVIVDVTRKVIETGRVRLMIALGVRSIGGLWSSGEWEGNRVTDLLVWLNNLLPLYKGGIEACRITVWYMVMYLISLC